MPIPPLDPITLVTAGLTITLRLFEITYQLKGVGPQTADLLKTVEHVSRNIKEARRLCQQKVDMLRREEREWMDGIIQDADDARLDVARLIEPVRIDQETRHSITLTHRALWVLRDKPDVVNKHRKLTETHQSLTSLIACLYSKDAIVITPVPDTSMTQQLSPPPYDPEMAAFFERRTSRRQRKSMSNLQDGSKGRSSSSGSVRSGANHANSTTSLCPPPPAPLAQGPSIDESVPRTSHAEFAGFGLNEAALWGSDDQQSFLGPNSGPGYLDESAALHALQHLNLANADPAIPNYPARPPKIPLTSVMGSQSNDIVERATVQKLASRGELEPNYTTSPYRRAKTSWLAYHATRSDAGHCQSFS